MNAGCRLAMLAASCVSFATACSARPNPPATPASGPAVPLVIAHAGTIHKTVDVQGRVGSPNGDSAKLSFAQPGILKTIDVRVGQSVVAGQALAELDRAPLSATLVQAAADERSASAAYDAGEVGAAALQSANERLAVAQVKARALQGAGPVAAGGRIEAAAAAHEAELKLQADRAAVARQQKLFDAGVVARKDLEAAQLQAATDAADVRTALAKVAVAANETTSALAQARADVAAAQSDAAAAKPQNVILASEADAARAKLAAARIAYESGAMVAPADGVVLAILKHPGEFVDTTVPVVEIGSSPLGTVTLTASAGVAREVARGDAVTIRVRGENGGSTGHIVSVVRTVDNSMQSIIMLATGAPAGAMPGDAVAATISVGSQRGILVPQSAIVEDPETGKSVVFVHQTAIHGGSPAFEMRVVSTGATDASNVVVTSGLRTGESIASQGGYALLAPVGGG